MNRVTCRMFMFLVIALPAAALAQSAPVVSVDVSLDPAASGIAAVQKAAELLKASGQGPDAAIAFFTDALNQARNYAVQRAIRFQLADLYGQAGRPDKALEVLKDQIASIPPTPQPTLVQVVPAEATTTGGGATPQQ
jgi:tetratricopeptide (TPR) repeat protein